MIGRGRNRKKNREEKISSTFGSRRWKIGAFLLRRYVKSKMKRLFVLRIRKIEELRIFEKSFPLSSQTSHSPPVVLCSIILRNKIEFGIFLSSKSKTQELNYSIFGSGTKNPSFDFRSRAS